MVAAARWLRGYGAGLIAFALSLVATAAIAWQLDRVVAAKDEERFAAASDRLHEAVARRLATYTDMLRATAGMLDVEGPFDRGAFQRFVRRLELQTRYPGILGVGFSRRVLPGEMSRVLADQRIDFPDFRIWPDAPRAEYHSILYLEPLNARNRAAIGYDMFSEPTRQAAMARARDTGEAAASGPVTLVQEIDEVKQPGFLIYLPVYAGGGIPATVEERRARLRGFVYSPFRAGDLFEGILAAEREPRAGFLLVDSERPDLVLYRSSEPATEGLTQARALPVAGREWVATYFPLPGLARTSYASIVPIVAWSGVGVSLVLAGLVALQARAHRRIRRSERETLEASHRFQQLANSIPQLAWMARADGWIYWYNDRWYDYTGTTPEQMAGWGWQRVHDPDILPRVLERWRASIATGRSFEMEFPLRRADGQFRWFLTRVVPLRSESGEVLHWFGTNTDVQALRDAERAAREQAETLELVNMAGAQLAAELDLQKLVQALTDAGVRLTRAGFGAFFYNVTNDAGESYTLYTLSGLPREAFERFPMPRNTQVFGPTFSGAGIVRSDDITRDPRYGHNAPYRGMPPGHPPVRSYLAVPVASRSGEVLGGLFFGHPEPARFTETHERMLVGVAAQAAVAIDNARLYNRVQDLLERERAARSEAERVSQLKDEFLATLSHELRTPLNAVVGWTHLLQQGVVPPDQIDQALATIVRNVQAQSQLIDDLLDMSRIVSGRLRIEPTEVHLAEVVEAAIGIVRPAAEAKGVAIRAALDAVPPMPADPARLQQVFWNLLSNAVKFTERGGRIDVALRQQDAHVEIEVRDTGIGIDPEFLPCVFERFRQADASIGREYGGLGLGLSIVQSLVHMHGGTVRAHSQGRGTGAAFVVRLPLAVGSAAQSAGA